MSQWEPTCNFSITDNLPPIWRGANWLIGDYEIAVPMDHQRYDRSIRYFKDTFEAIRYALDQGACIMEDLRMGEEWRAELARRNKRRRR
jgi:hypothetical protein